MLDHSFELLRRYDSRQIIHAIDADPDSGHYCPGDSSCELVRGKVERASHD